MGLILDGRNIPETENIVGMFVNTLPFQFYIDENISINTLLAAINKKVSEIYEIQTYSLQDINDDYKKKFNERIIDKMNIFYEFNNYIPLALEELNNKFEINGYHSKETQVDYLFRITTGKDFYQIQVNYSSYIYTDRFVDEFIKEYLDLLDTFLNMSEKLLKEYLFETYDSSDNEEIDISFNF